MVLDRQLPLQLGPGGVVVEEGRLLPRGRIRDEAQHIAERQTRWLGLLLLLYDLGVIV